MKKQFCISLFIILLMFSMSSAQDSVLTVSKNKHTYLDFSAGYLKTDLGSVNSTLKSFGYKPFSENFATISFSFGLFYNRFLLRNEISILLPNQVNQSNEIITKFGGYTIGFGLGYALIQKPKFRLSPFVGINAFTTKLEIEDHSSVENMNDVLNSPHRSAKLYFSNASLDIGLQIEKLFQLKNRTWDCPQNSRFLTMGLRLGYNFSPGIVNGSHNNSPVTDAPSYSYRGPYVKLTFGFSTKMRDLKWKR